MNMQKQLSKLLYPVIIDAYKKGGEDQQNGDFDVKEFEKDLKKIGVDMLKKAKKEVRK